MKFKRVHVIISGFVQGVGFRYAAVDWASKNNLVGWVKNTLDGKVEIVAEGDNEIINEFISWCSKGPSMAKVLDVEVIEINETEKLSFDRFEIKH